MLTTDKCSSGAPMPLIVSGCTRQTKSQCHAISTASEHNLHLQPQHTTQHTTPQHSHSHPLPHPHPHPHPQTHTHQHKHNLPHSHPYSVHQVHKHPIPNSRKYSADTPRRDLHELLLELLDVLLSCLVVAPCVIAYWRGTWELMGVLLFPSSLPLSALASFVIGGLGHFLFIVTQNFFKDHIHPDKRRLTYYAISRIYTAVFGVVCVNMWRGSWMLCDWLTSIDSLVIISVVTLVALLFLVGTRTLRNLGAAPYTVTMDHKSDYFEVDTMFKISGFNQPGLYLLDTLFSVFVIGSLVVIAWRGLWGIFDLTLFPQDKAKSAWGSLLIGYLTVFVTFIIQPLMRYVCRRISGILKLIICDIYYLMIFFGAVNAWRGIWNLLDVYVYPDDRILSFWVTHIIPFLLLAALKCSNSILVRGVFIDAEGSGADCVHLPINYVRLHFLRERRKKVESEQYRHCHDVNFEPPDYYLKSEHTTLAKHLEKDKEAQHSLIEKPQKPPQII